MIGAIDGCNIKFKCPNLQQGSYIDKNRNHSIKLQRIVTSNKVFTNIMVGFPGSAHDSRVKKYVWYFILPEKLKKPLSAIIFILPTHIIILLILNVFNCRYSGILKFIMILSTMECLENIFLMPIILLVIKLIH